VILVSQILETKRLPLGNLRLESVQHIGNRHEDIGIAKIRAVFGVDDVIRDKDAGMDDAPVQPKQTTLCLYTHEESGLGENSLIPVMTNPRPLSYFRTIPPKDGSKSWLVSPTFRKISPFP
jgi:hypothetical protein